MVTREQLSESKAIQRRTGRTFHLATRLLPRRIRHATYVLYAFFRTADDVVDTPDRDRSADAQRADLERLRAGALGQGEPADPVVAAFSEMREEHGIPDREVEAFLEAMEQDVHTDQYESREALAEYMRGSAVAVGNMMLHVMGASDLDAARPHAAALAEAFQLTNFLRDVREDVRDHGRIYLPATIRERHGVTAAQIEAERTSEGFETAILSELARTETKYREGVAGIRLLPADCQFGVLVSAVLYAEHHRAIRDRGGDVLTSAPSIGLARKLWLVARTRLHWARCRDPETVFRRVSAVPFREEARNRRSGEPSPAR